MVERRAMRERTRAEELRRQLKVAEFVLDLLKMGPHGRRERERVQKRLCNARRKLRAAEREAVES